MSRNKPFLTCSAPDLLLITPGPVATREVVGTVGTKEGPMRVGNGAMVHAGWAPVGTITVPLDIIDQYNRKVRYEVGHVVEFEPFNRCGASGTHRNYRSRNGNRWEAPGTTVTCNKCIKQAQRREG